MIFCLHTYYKYRECLTTTLLGSCGEAHLCLYTTLVITIHKQYRWLQNLDNPFSSSLFCTTHLKCSLQMLLCRHNHHHNVHCRYGLAEYLDVGRDCGPMMQNPTLHKLLWLRFLQVPESLQELLTFCRCRDLYDTVIMTDEDLQNDALPNLLDCESLVAIGPSSSHLFCLPSLQELLTFLDVGTWMILIFHYDRWGLAECRLNIVYITEVTRSGYNVSIVSFNNNKNIYEKHLWSNIITLQWDLESSPQYVFLTIDTEIVNNSCTTCSMEVTVAEMDQTYTKPSEVAHTASSVQYHTVTYRSEVMEYTYTIFMPR